MAEGWFRHLLGNEHTVASAGLEPKRVHPKAIVVMNEAGVDISAQTSDHIEKYIGGEFDYIITVCDNAAANCPTFPGGGERIHWPFDDPDAATGTEDEILNEFRRVRDEIRDSISTWIDSLNKTTM